MSDVEISPLAVLEAARAELAAAERDADIAWQGYELCQDAVAAALRRHTVALAEYDRWAKGRLT